MFRITPKQTIPLPPKGTRFISTSELENPPDFARALDLIVLNNISFSRRPSYPFASKAKTFLNDNIDELRKAYGYQTKLLSTKNQNVIICYNSHEINVLFEGSDFKNIWHYRRNALSYFLNQRAAPTASFEGTLHKGFNGVLDKALQTSEQPLYDAIQAEISQLLKQNPTRSLYLCGHSSGGAIACICAARLYDAGVPIAGIYTYGQPRFADRAFKNSYAAVLGDKTFRFERYGDPVPALPPYHTERHVHCGQWVPMDATGHILQMEDESVIEDTLSRSNPQLNEQIPTDGAAERSGKDTKTSALPKNTRDSLKGLTSSFQLHLYTHHLIGMYVETLLNHADITHTRPSSLAAKTLLDVNLMVWQLDSIADSIHETAPLFASDETRIAVWQLKDKLFSAIDDWKAAHKETQLPKAEAAKQVFQSHQNQKAAKHLDNLLKEYQAYLLQADGQRQPSGTMSLTQAISQSIDAARQSLKEAHKVSNAL